MKVKKVLFQFLVGLLLCGLGLLYAASPTIISEPKTKVYEDSMYNYLLVGSDTDLSDELNWVTDGVNPLPSWLSLSEKQNYILRFAGLAPYSGEDVNATKAQLRGPDGIELDEQGNLYFADRENHVIRKVDTDGIITTIAGIPGKSVYTTIDGKANLTGLYNPYDIKKDSDGNFFVTSGPYIKKIATDGNISTFAILSNVVYSLYIDEYDNIFATTADSKIYKVDRNKNITHLAGKGSPTYLYNVSYNGSNTSFYANTYESNETNATNAQFYQPQNVVSDANGNIYIADTNNHLIRKVDTNGTVSIFAGIYTDQDENNESYDYNSAYGNDGDGGNATSAKIRNPRALAFDSNGSLIFHSYDGLRKIDTNGIITTIKTGMYSVNKIKIDANDNIYISDNYQYIKKLSADYATLTTIAGQGSNNATDTTEGSALLTKLNNPNGIVMDSSGNLFVSSGNKIHKVDTNSQISNFSTSTAGNINKMAIDSSNTIYYTTSNRRVEKVTSAGTVSVVANTAGTALNTSTELGTNSPNGDGGLAVDAKFYNLEGIAVSTDGTLYVTDIYAQRVRKIETNGTITTFAGTGAQGSQYYIGTYSGDDGQAVNAGLNNPYDVAIDSSGNVYIADYGNSRVRKVDTNGIITTFASGVNAYGLSIDQNDNLIAAENSRVRKYPLSSGVGEIIAGDGTTGYYNDNGLANEARFYYVYDSVTDEKGNIYLTDRNNAVVRKVMKTNLLYGIPENSDLNGNIIENYNITVNVTDGTNIIPHTFIIAVHNTNDVPTSEDQNKTLDEDSSITLSSGDIVFNDIDPTNDTLSKIRIKNLPTKGTLYLDVNNNDNVDENETVVYNTELTASEMNNLKYIPNANGFGNNFDNFSFIINDGMVYGYEYKITFNVTGVNDDETGTVSVDQSLNVDEDNNVTVNYTYSNIDLDTLTPSVKTQPLHGQVEVNSTSVTYIPDVNFNGNDSFQITFSDSEYSSDVNFSVNVAPMNDLPTIAPISSLSTNEDSAFNIDLNVTDIDEQQSFIGTLVLESNASNGTVTINGTAVHYVPNTNYYGTDSFEISAVDSNGSKTTTNIMVTIVEQNDTPMVTTTHNDIVVLEDNGTTNYEFNVTDVEGSELNVTVTSSDENLVRVSSSWNGLINQANYTNLDFNITTVPNANGVATITITLEDTEGEIGTTSFDINVTAVNDAPILNPISDLITYKNTPEINVSIEYSDIDSDNLVFSQVINDNNVNLIEDINITNNTMTIKLNDNLSGNADINLTLSDGEFDVSRAFRLKVLSLNYDTNESLKTGGRVEYDENETIIVRFDDATVTAPTKPDVNGSISHEIDFGTKKVTATSDINGSVVVITDNGVKTTFEDNTTHVKAEVNATITGKASHTLTTTNGKTTTATSEFVGAQTVIKKDGSNQVEIETSVVIDTNTTVKVIAKEDGTAEHTVATNGKTTKATSDVVGATTLITSTGTVETSAGDVNATQAGYKIKALALTKPDGTTTTSFIKVNSTTGATEEVMGNTVKPTTPFGAGNSVEIKEIGGTLYIKTSAPLDANLIIE